MADEVVPEMLWRVDGSQTLECGNGSKLGVYAWQYRDKASGRVFSPSLVVTLVSQRDPYNVTERSKLKLPLDVNSEELMPQLQKLIKEVRTQAQKNVAQEG